MKTGHDATNIPAVFTMSYVLLLVLLSKTSGEVYFFPALPELFLSSLHEQHIITMLKEF